MHDCIVDEGNGRVRLLKIDEGKEEVTLGGPRQSYYRGFRVRRYEVERNGKTNIYLIASEDPLELDEAIDLVENLNPDPI